MRPSTMRRRAPAGPRAFLAAGYALGVSSCAALACGFDQSNAIDLPRTEGVPVELKNVRMAESLAAPLGPLPTTFSSSDANAIGIAFDVHLLEAAPHHAGVSARIACRVGEHTIVAPMASNASDRLATAAVGSRFEERTTFMPMPFSNGIPDVCETTLVYMIAPPLSHVPSPGDPAPPRPHMQAIGTVCFSGGKLEQGACGSAVLPRTPASTPVEASRLIGRIAPLSGGGHGLGVTVMATAGEGVPQQFLVGGEASCEVDGATRDVALGLLMFGTDLRPGESVVESAATRPSDALPSAPAWCTVRVQLADHGERRLLAEFCVRGDETTQGACVS